MVFLRARVVAFKRSRLGARSFQVVRVLFVLAVLAWLGYRLSSIGWQEVWVSRPRTPWFYVTWVGLYLQLPLVEALIFRSVWGLPIRESLLPLLHKRTLNQDVVSGLGEASFFMWVRRDGSLSDGEIAGTLKDNLIASSLASWTSIVLLFLLTGPLLLTTLLADSGPLYVVGGGLLTILVIVLGMHFRRRILTLEPRTVLTVTLVHFGRFVLFVYLLQVIQWWVVEPDAPLRLWAAMLVVATVVSRVPFIPAKDLVGIGAILGVLVLPEAFEATIAAMLLMRTVLDKVTNLVVAVIHFALDRGSRSPASLPADDAMTTRSRATP